MLKHEFQNVREIFPRFTSGILASFLIQLVMHVAIHECWFSGHTTNEKPPYQVLSDVYYHKCLSILFYASSYTYISDSWIGPLFGNLARRAVSHGLGWLAPCCAGPAARRGVRPACRAGCPNREKHENVAINDSSWIQKVHTEEYATWGLKLSALPKV